jgi:hypothetical protein
MSDDQKAREAQARADRREAERLQRIATGKAVRLPREAPNNRRGARAS